MQKEIKEAIKNIIDYLYIDEKKDFESTELKENHIYNDILIVDNWLKENQ